MKKSSIKLIAVAASCLLIFSVIKLSAFAKEQREKDSKKQVQIKWMGHSSFSIANSKGTEILTDPFDTSVGYEVKALSPDIVTISHDHFDHNYTDALTGDYKLVKEAGKVNHSEIKIEGTLTYHDESQGQERGNNIVYTYKTDDINICHLGDLGHVLTEDNIKSIGKVDILFIPVGGVYTIDGAAASKVVAQLNPKIVVPMHYNTPKLSPGFGINNEEDFLNAMKGYEVSTKDSLSTSKAELNKIDKTQIVFLKY